MNSPRSPPPLDERLAQPETHTQVVDGVTVRTMGATPPHAIQHAAAAHVLRGCLAPGYLAALDMLTRLDADNDRAADVSIFPAAPDEETGRRQLEEITFEVCDSQRANDVSEKARRFVARGVRRVFHVRVDEGAVYEWRRASDAWEHLGDSDAIEDRCFVVPIPAQALLQRVLADDTVARALLARGNAILTAAVDAARAAVVSDGRKAGHDEGALVATRALLLRTMELRRLAVTDALRARVAACDDLAALTRWHDLAVLAAGADEVFA